MGVGGQRHVPAALPPGMTWCSLCRRWDEPHGRSGRVWKISHRPARSESLFLQRYPGRRSARFREGKYFIATSGIEPHFLGLPARSVVTTHAAAVTSCYIFRITGDRARKDHQIRQTRRVGTKHFGKNKWNSISCAPYKEYFDRVLLQYVISFAARTFNPLKTKRMFYIRTQCVPRCKHSLLRL
jgi:hypothetical protein